MVIFIVLNLILGRPGLSTYLIKRLILMELITYNLCYFSIRRLLYLVVQGRFIYLKINIKLDNLAYCKLMILSNYLNQVLIVNLRDRFI